LLNNTNLARVGFAHGIDALILLNPGCPSASNEMVATTVEAICGAAYSDAVDAGEDGYDVVRGIMERLGLFNTPLLV
jgi:dsRNA-specific ribonuclease